MKSKKGFLNNYILIRLLLLLLLLLLLMMIDLAVAVFFKLFIVSAF